MMNDSFQTINDCDLRYLKLLSRSFPDIATASTEIINLEAILHLPKGTEHFLADLHGEFDSFQHVLRNASGTIKRKVREIFSKTLCKAEQKELCTLIYYPEQKLELVKKELTDSEEELTNWYFITINRLVKVCRNVSSKYTRSKVHKALPSAFSYIIQELLHENSDDKNKQAYVDGIVQAIISTHRSDMFIVAMCNLIHRLTIDTLHVLGDIYDRGPFPHKIMDILGGYHNFDVQWGNHDVLWMGAASGNDCCIANVIRGALRYGNQSVLEEGYGITLLPLATLAIDFYGDDECAQFLHDEDDALDLESQRTNHLAAKMHKAISIIQFKLEGQTIMRRPEFEMENRLLLDKVKFDKGVIEINGIEYELTDNKFPTVYPDDPYRLTPEEESVVNKLRQSFTGSEKLKKHMKCLFTNGCIYTVTNGNLLFHASIPLNEDGSFRKVTIQGEQYCGEELLKKTGALIRTAYFGDEDPMEYAFAKDYVWYLWCGKDSPVFDKNKMATFERYFIKDKSTHSEKKGFYYTLRNNEDVCDMILNEFGVDGQFRHIINGHVPVLAVNGENPVKANGKVLVIDGGFSKAYQPKTGIAGYTLVYHSKGFQLVQHEPFTSITQAVQEGQDIKSTVEMVEMTNHRMMVQDTDMGKELSAQIADLKKLLQAYRLGLIKERSFHPITNKQ